MIEFRILGTVNLIDADGRELRPVLSQPKRVALLAYLAASTRGFHRRDSLLALFWPELDQAHARAALRQALHGLRRSLGGAVIESRGGEEVRFAHERAWCDVRAFEDAADRSLCSEALELYRGDLLGGFFIAGAPEFERWLEDERVRLRRRAVDIAWARAEECRTDGDSTLAAHWARHAAGLVRDDEAALRRLITLLGDLGDRAGALQAYDIFARRLADEYAAEPSAETRAVIALVRSREQPAPVEVTPVPFVTPPPPVETEPLTDAADPPAGSERIPRDSSPRESADVLAAHIERAQRVHPRRIRLPLSVAVLAAATVTFGAALVWGGDAPDLDPTRIVVAGVSNRTGDTTLDALAELVREEITRGLALTEVVEIVDPGASRGFGNMRPRRLATRNDEAAAARELAVSTGSGLALWASIDRRGEQREFAASIVDLRGGKLLRALEPVPVDPSAPRPALRLLRDRVMTVVAEAVDPRLGASASVAGGPPRYEAYEAFVTGVGIWYDGRNGRDALPHFQRAAQLDSTFALPMIWAAWVHQTFGQCDSTSAIAGRLEPLHLSRLERLQMDRQLARCRGDLPGAYRLARALVDARPGSEVWQEQLARDALNFQRPREAIEVLGRLHPDRGALRSRASYYNWLTNAHHLLGEHEAELAVAQRGRARFPGNLAAWRTEALALAGLRRSSEALARFDEIDALAPDPLRRKPTVLREIALDIAAHGDTGTARKALARTLAWHAQQSPADQLTRLNRFERAQTYFAAAHDDSARAIVEALVNEDPLDDQSAGLLGVLAARQGDREAAARMAARLARAPDTNGRGHRAWWRACIAAQLGQRDEAVSLLRKALAEGYVFNGFFFLSAHLEPGFAPLRGYEPFEELLRPKG